MTNSSYSGYRADIDGLRAIAVLSVVIFHAFPDFLKGGFVGVDIFFVISGFLISGIIYQNLENKKFSFIDFYGRRIRRIFPALILVMLFCLFFGWQVLLAEEYKQLGKHVTCGAMFVSNFCLWLESGYFDNSAESKPLLHLWSLGIEEQFYIVWPLFLWLSFRYKKIILPLLAVFIFISFYLSLFFSTQRPIEAFYLPPTRFWELFAGATLAYFSVFKKNITFIGRSSNFISIIGIFLIIIGIIAINKTDPFPGWRALFPVAGAFMLIAAGEKAFINRNILANKYAVWIGLISYPLYLWHWPLLAFARVIYADRVTTADIFAIIAVSIFLSWLTYILLEKPIRFGNKIVLKTISLLVAMSLVSGMGYIVYIREGISERNDIFHKLYSLTRLNIVTEWRFHDCHMQIDQGDKNFPDRDLCVDQNKRPLVVLWGDSIAASLYAGLKNLQKERKFGIAQFTANSCPPLVGYENPKRNLCKEINDDNIKYFKKIKPDIVLLAAAWRDGSNYPLEYLANTVQQLKNSGIKKIVMLGQLPSWKAELPRVLLNNSIDYRLQNKFPLYVKDSLYPNLENIDINLQKLANNLNIEYISTYKLMCTQEGCMTQTDKGTPAILFFDSDHMTPEGATWLFNNIQNQLMK